MIKGDKSLKALFVKIGNDHLHAMASVPKAFVSCLFGKTDCHALLIFASVNILRSKKKTCS